MYELIIHDDATQDLHDIIASDKGAGLKIAVLLEELKTNQDLLDRLTQHKFGGKPSRPDPKHAEFNISVWAAMQKKDQNLWRLRFFDPIVDSYRVVYGYYPGSDTYVVLGVFEKSATDIVGHNYEPESPFARRIAHIYKELDDELW